MDDDTIDTLREIVQDMTQTVDLISSGSKAGDSLIHFLEEMLRTIEAWAAKYDIHLDGESLQHNGNSSIPIDAPSVPGVSVSLLDPLLDGAITNANDSLDCTDGKLGENQRETGPNLKPPGNEEKRSCRVSTAADQMQALSDSGPTLRERGRCRTTLEAIASEEIVEEMETGGSDVAEADAKWTKSSEEGNIVMVVDPSEAVATEATERNVGDRPDWLPKGWIMEQKIRETGNTAGTKDKYFFDPVSKRRFRSRKEVLAFLNRGNKQQISEGRPKRQSRKKQELDQNLPTTELAGNITQEKSTNETPNTTVELNLEHQESMTQLATDALEHAVVTAPLTPVLSGSLIPSQPGQPSEWHVYENLANLPYPLYEHMRLTETSANKGDANSVPLAPWPWLFGNNEGLKRPFVDNKSDDNRKPAMSEETEKTKPVPKRSRKTARKNAN